MAAKKTRKKNMALVHSTKKPEITDLGKASGKMLEAFSTMSDVLSTIKDEQLPDALVLVTQLERITGEYESMVKDRIRSYVQTRGERITEAGSMRAIAGDSALRIQPNRTGLDPKQIEALLTKKGIALTEGMDPEITYSVNVGKLKALVEAKKLSQADLDASHYELTYKVMPPKKLETDPVGPAPEE